MTAHFSLTMVLFALAIVLTSWRAWWLGRVEEEEYADYDWERGGQVIHWVIGAWASFVLFLVASILHLTRGIDPIELALNAFYRSF